MTPRRLPAPRWMLIKKLGALALLVPGALAPLPAGCADSAPGAPPGEDELSGRVTISGSSTCAPLVSEIARRFERLHPGMRVDVQTGGSSRGIADVGTGLADVGMSSRALAVSEGEGRVSRVLARDGVCFVVHRDNPVPALDDAQIRGIYTGKITSWREVGGRDAPITVIDRAQGRSELELVTAYLGIRAADIEADAIAGENQQGIKQVAGDPTAIVYMSVGTTEFEEAHGTPIRRLPLRGVEASSENVASGVYPLARPLVLITAPEPSRTARAFVEYACSEAVHDLIRDQCFVPAHR